MGKFTADQLHVIAQTSCGVLYELGPSVQWVHSNVIGDKKMVREHAKWGGFPANYIPKVSTIIDPTTAE